MRDRGPAGAVQIPTSGGFCSAAGTALDWACKSGGLHVVSVNSPMLETPHRTRKHVHQNALATKP